MKRKACHMYSHLVKAQAFSCGNMTFKNSARQYAGVRCDKCFTHLLQVTAGFELYAVFGPLVTKPVAINSVNKLLKWIKKEEDRLFILNSPTF